jgi:hypothetical protein
MTKQGPLSETECYSSSCSQRQKENVRTYESLPRVVAARARGGRGVGCCSRFQKRGLPRRRIPFSERCARTQQKGRCNERRGPSCHLAVPTMRLKAKLALFGNRLSKPLQAAKNGTAGTTTTHYQWGVIVALKRVSYMHCAHVVLLWETRSRVFCSRSWI